MAKEHLASKDCYIITDHDRRILGFWFDLYCKDGGLNPDIAKRAMEIFAQNPSEGMYVFLAGTALVDALLLEDNTYPETTIDEVANWLTHVRTQHYEGSLIEITGIKPVDRRLGEFIGGLMEPVRIIEDSLFLISQGSSNWDEYFARKLRDTSVQYKKLAGE